MNSKYWNQERRQRVSARLAQAVVHTEALSVVLAEESVRAETMENVVDTLLETACYLRRVMAAARARRVPPGRKPVGYWSDPAHLHQ